MTSQLREFLMRAAFRTDGGSLWRRLVRRLARRLLDADRSESWRKGEVTATMVSRPPWSTAGSKPIPPRELNSPGLNAAAVLPRPERPLPLFEPRLDLPGIPGEMPFDPLVADWMREVTEPYILWDAPKPEYGDLPPLRFGGLPVPESRGLPERPSPWVESGLPELGDVEDSLADLHRRHALFRLSTEEILRKRYSRVLHK